MVIRLFLDLTDVHYFGDIPEAPTTSTGHIEDFILFPTDYAFFKPDLDEINTRCGSLLDGGDADFFDVAKCNKLTPWIKERMLMELPTRYKEILTILLDFCNRALELGTGVVIEL